MSGSKKADSRYARLAKAHFQFSDGDVLLECPSAAKEEEEDEENVDVDVDVDVQRPDENAEPTRFVLQVHRSTLAANSTFFKTKFDKAGSKSRGDGKALQKVIMDEDLSIVLVLLGAMYNVPEAQSLLTDSKDWRLLLDVLMAADKYGFKLLRSFASSLLTSAPPSIPKDGAFQIYYWAARSGDQALVKRFLSSAAFVRPDKLPEETLEKLPAWALKKLLMEHKEHGGEMVSAIQQAFRATSTNKAGYLPASSASVAQRRLIRLQHTFFA